MKRAAQMKLIFVAVLALVAAILLLQNTRPVRTKLLFATIEMPHAIMLLVTLAIGFAAGLVAAGIWARRR